MYGNPCKLYRENVATLTIKNICSARNYIFFFVVSILLNTLYSRSKRILKSNKRNSSLHVTMSIANFTQTNFAPSQIRYPTSSLILISFRSSNRLRYRIVTLKEAKVGKVEALSSSSDVCRFLVQMQTQLLRAMGSNYF